MPEEEPDERLETFLTPRDWLRYAVGRFLAADLAFGHGATTALDEAAFLILEGLGLPIDALDPFLDAKLLRSERGASSSSSKPARRRASPRPISSTAPISKACRSMSTSA